MSIRTWPLAPAVLAGGLSCDSRRVFALDEAGRFLLAVTFGEGAELHDVRRKRSVLRIARPIRRGAISPDGQLVVTSEAEEEGVSRLRVWRPDRTEPIAVAATIVGEASVLAVAPGGRLLAVAVHDCRPGKTAADRLRLFELPSLAPRPDLPRSRNYVRSLTFSAGGTALAGVTLTSLILWSLRSRSVTRVWRRHVGGYGALTMDESGRRLLCISRRGACRLFDGRRRKVTAPFDHPVIGAAFWPEGLACRDRHSVALYELGAKGHAALLARYRAPVEHWYTPDLRRSVHRRIDDRIELCDVRTARRKIINPPRLSKRQREARKRRDLDAGEEEILRAGVAFLSRYDASDLSSLLARNLERSGPVRDRARGLLEKVEQLVRKDWPNIAPLAPLAIDGLSDGDAAQRCAALRALRFAATRSGEIQSTVDQVATLLGRDSEDQVRVQAARRLWLFCRAGRYPKSLSTLRQTAGKAGHAAFFAGLALSQHSWQQRRKPWRGLKRDLSFASPDIGEKSPLYSSHDTWFCSDSPIHHASHEGPYGEAANHERQPSDRPCGLCGRVPTTRVYWWDYADNTCHQWIEEVKCEACGRYTVYDVDH